MMKSFRLNYLEIIFFRNLSYLKSARELSPIIEIIVNHNSFINLYFLKLVNFINILEMDCSS